MEPIKEPTASATLPRSAAPVVIAYLVSEKRETLGKDVFSLSFFLFLRPVLYNTYMPETFASWLLSFEKFPLKLFSVFSSLFYFFFFMCSFSYFYLPVQFCIITRIIIGRSSKYLTIMFSLWVIKNLSLLDVFARIKFSPISIIKGTEVVWWREERYNIVSKPICKFI